MTTKEAFSQLVSKRAWYKELEIAETQASSLKKRFKDGTITLEKMEEILELAGYKVIQEKQWTTS